MKLHSLTPVAAFYTTLLPTQKIKVRKSHQTTGRCDAMASRLPRVRITAKVKQLSLFRTNFVESVGMELLAGKASLSFVILTAGRTTYTCWSGSGWLARLLAYLLPLLLLLLLLLGGFIWHFFFIIFLRVPERAFWQKRKLATGSGGGGGVCLFGVGAQYSRVGKGLHLNFYGFLAMNSLPASRAVSPPLARQKCPLVECCRSVGIMRTFSSFCINLSWSSPIWKTPLSLLGHNITLQGTGNFFFMRIQIRVSPID